jgi:hypothetical protein
MKSILATAIKAGLMYMIRNYAASIVFDMIVEQAEKLSRRTDTEIDDKAVAMLKSDKSDFIAAIKGRI